MIKEKKKGGYESNFSGGLMVVRINGEIDHHSAVEMRTGMDAEIFESRPSKLILDLSGVDFMDSSGLGLILGRLANMRKVGGELVVLNPNEGVMKILKLAGAERILKIETVEISSEKDRKRGVRNGK